MEERLGEGAAGIVYRAVHVGLEKSFAIKLLKNVGHPAPAALERFRREAVALGRLRHPNIVDVTDSGIDEAAGGVPYIVTELLEGVSLADLCRFQGPQALAQALPLLRQIAAAVDAAHNAGVLHRDLKPGNVFVCSKSPEPPIVKVLDFGLAELLTDKPGSGTLPDGKESLARLTTTGGLVGTPLYVAPELIRLGQASRSSDIYSFGVLAYEILGGQPPFRGTLEEVLNGHLVAEPPPLPLHPEVWRALWDTLQKDPALRPGTAGEVVRRFQTAEFERAYRRSLADPKPIDNTASKTREQAPTKPRSNFLLMAAVLFCVALVGILGFMTGRGYVPSAENTHQGTRRPVEAQAPAFIPSVSPELRPAEPLSSTVPASPGVMFDFKDIQQACGDLSSLTNYLCLVNRGSEQIAGGARLVLTENLASFSSRASYGNSISINIEGKERYSFDFAAPKGKALISGLYTGAMRWPFNAGPYPGIDATVGSSGCNTEDGRFRIWQILLTGDYKVRRFVADFKTTCNAAIGRIAVGDQESAPPVIFVRRPAEPPLSTAPTSPGVKFKFDDIEQACGDLSTLPNYLCLVNRGSEEVAGGGRLVIDENLASFTSRTTHSNGIWISVEGKERYSLDFGPPKGKPLTLGLYTGATRWPFNDGPNPGIDFSVGSSGCNTEEGQFRILQVLLTGDKLRRFVADFETTCNGGIGRVAVGEKIDIQLKPLPRKILESERRPGSV